MIVSDTIGSNLSSSLGGVGGMSSKLSFKEFLDFLKENLNFKFDIDNDNFNERFKLQKYVYFAKRCGLKISSVSYSIYHYGPYSPNLAKLYYNNEHYENKIIDINNFDKNKFLNIISDKDNKWLELASTVDSIFRYNNENMENKDTLRKKVINKVTNLKYCSKKDVDKIIIELEEYNLIN